MKQCEVCGGHFELIHSTHYACNTCELNILDGVYVVTKGNDKNYHAVKVLDRKIFDPEKIEVSKEAIISFLDQWLINAGSLKYHADTISLIKKLTPIFSYQGNLVRGLCIPYVRLKRPGVVECIDSWSKSMNGIRKYETFAEFSFGQIRVSDGAVLPYTTQEFIDINVNISPSQVDMVISGDYTGLDLYLLARYVDYREDFMEKLKEVEEVLVIQKMN
ncbi:hypothetical protein SMD22_00425 (plasmid) [Brevibacillus halotolerans]|nr:hypothetical protein SMD22_00425 [Brevibacillus halotolerans]